MIKRAFAAVLIAFFAIAHAGVKGIATPTFVPYTLSKAAIPFIALSSGSVSAPGAITGITALPTTYASAYCWFPANILATAIAAGWYYCTFSSATVGTAFLNTYSTGTPTIPAAPTAVTDGKGAFTGASTELFGPTISVPANTLGLTGELQITANWSMTNTAAAKTTAIRYSGTAGTAFMSGGPTSQSGRQDGVFIANRGVANLQVGTPSGNVGGWGQNGSVGSTYGTADTTAATSVVFCLTNATPATNNLILERYEVKVSLFP